MEKINYGSLIIIGGAEDKKGDKEILKVVCDKTDKEKDPLVIITAATEFPKEVGEQYKIIFRELGVKQIEILNIDSREDAFDADNVNKLNSAGVIFFTGGDQLRITSIIGGTPLYNSIKNRFEQNCVIVGTSAGASVMSDTMVVQGPDDQSPKKCTLKMAPGLGLLRGAIVDQHFAQRGRLGRLLVGIAENPQSLGIGIDEDTAVLVDNKNILKVIGSGAVYIIDGTTITQSNVSEQNPNEILSIFDVKIHVLKSGNTFDIVKRIPHEKTI